MQSYVNKILAPYFEQVKKVAGRPPSQKTIWMLDVWSVQRSEKFRAWMKSTHPTIILDYVPGGCTPVGQPCDVGMQRPFKLSVKKSYQEDVVKEAIEQIHNGNETITFDNRLAVHRDRSVRWLKVAFDTINNESLVKKVSTRFNSK
ncbi:hypothetical protein K435DRAFT_686052 [Dendrothele bispora CBS 962.96]|uniref:DDE-1 domain-containing protein n=1 Tax=Dendrothele bispora (strain CBS 962.96) TaxID=1314807 RepID=A0A4S8L8X4_DENBC|nr:hypothetical protein K435DRAFT_686052 [Dendrothele bispora CBS 962.96]